MILRAAWKNLRILRTLKEQMESINEYVAVFDAKYRNIEKKKMTLPAEILAFKLLREANITKEEKLL